MIKKLLLIGMCMIIICMCGCKAGKGDTSQNVISYAEEFVVGQDSSYMFQKDNNGSLMTKTEVGYYFRLGNSLYYADRELTAVLPLCSKITCEHIGQDDCEAYIGNAMAFSNIQYYKGRLYTDSVNKLSDTSELYTDEKGDGIYAKLYEISGDAKKKNELDILKVTGVSPIIHRGYAYCYYMESVEKIIDGKTKNVKYGVLSRTNMETGEEERFIDCSTEVITDKSWIQEIYAYRNYVYFVTSSGELYIYDIMNESFEKVDNLKDIRFWFMDDKIIYRHGSGESEEKRKVFIAKLDFSEPQYAFSLDNERYVVGSDNKYIYADNRFKAFSEKTDRIIYYYDKNTYELLGEINLGTGTGLERYGYGDENYYFYIENGEDGSRLMCVVKASLATGNIEKRVLLEW